MKRKDRQIKENQALEILKNGEYGILSTVSANQVPYGVPLNYCVIDKAIYFHCARVGLKLDNISANQQVSFCVVGKTEVRPSEFSTKYESCIVAGTAEEVEGEEKKVALEGLVLKYSADYIHEGAKYIKNDHHKTRVIKIAINDIIGKARK